MGEKKVTIRLTPEQAKLVWLNVDGWIDAGACKGGLEPAEREALGSLEGQILKQLHPKKKKTSREPSA